MTSKDSQNDPSRTVRDEWFQNLARSTIVQGQWRPHDQHAIQRTAAVQIHDAMAEVESYAVLGAEAFNWSAPPDRFMRVLHLSPPRENPDLSGIILLQQGTQLRVEYRPYRIEATLIAHMGYERESRELRLFTPQVDPHGGVTWTDQNGQAFDVGTIVKTLFSDLVQANFELHAFKAANSSVPPPDVSR